MSEGASINIQDRRVSKGIAWFGGIIAALFVIAVGAVANNLWQVNLTLRDMLAEGRSVRADLNRNDQRDDRQDAILGQHGREISTLNGRNLRGGQEHELSTR